MIYNRIIISDVHLGTPNCKIKEVNDFLKKTKSKELILNGDIIDGWFLKRSSRFWSKHHTKFIEIILEKIRKDNLKLIYLRGNHDDFLSSFLNFSLGGIELLEKYEFITSKGNKYVVLHGDVFDTITTHAKWLSLIGDISYNFLLKLNRYYNTWRKLTGKPYFSLSGYVKSKVKMATNFISGFEKCIVNLARSGGYDGVICGHIHQAASYIIDEIHYMNSGDWVESMTAIVEDSDGNLKLINYHTI